MKAAAAAGVRHLPEGPARQAAEIDLSGAWLIEAAAANQYCIASCHHRRPAIAFTCSGGGGERRNRRALRCRRVEAPRRVGDRRLQQCWRGAAAVTGLAVAGSAQ